MRLKEYLINKIGTITIFILGYCFILFALIAFKNNFSLTFLISLLYMLVGISIFIINYKKKKRFYTEFLMNLDKLDNKYLISEIIEIPDFYEGRILTQVLYEIGKSMNSHIKEYETITNDFRHYIELWIHEVKVPLSALRLIAHIEHNKEIVEPVKLIEDYVEQVLYYTRSENTEEDYFITKCNLSKIISNVAIRNKDIIFRKNIDLIVENTDYTVLTDSKWLEFILNQIISNSIKYKKNEKSYIKITVKDKMNLTTLIIEDNGIGIPLSDLSRVFNKSFTGKNGRIKSSSTGMGLFIVKKMCDKLGHKISIESEENEQTRVYITFDKNDFYNVVN